MLSKVKRSHSSGSESNPDKDEIELTSTKDEITNMMKSLGLSENSNALVTIDEEGDAKRARMAEEQERDKVDVLSKTCIAPDGVCLISTDGVYYVGTKNDQIVVGLLQSPQQSGTIRFVETNCVPGYSYILIEPEFMVIANKTLWCIRVDEEKNLIMLVSFSVECTSKYDGEVISSIGYVDVKMLHKMTATIRTPSWLTLGLQSVVFDYLIDVVKNEEGEYKYEDNLIERNTTGAESQQWLNPRSFLNTSYGRNYILSEFDSVELKDGRVVPFVKMSKYRDSLTITPEVMKIALPVNGTEKLEDLIPHVYITLTAVTNELILVNQRKMTRGANRESMNDNGSNWQSMNDNGSINDEDGHLIRIPALPDGSYPTLKNVCFTIDPRKMEATSALITFEDESPIICPLVNEEVDVEMDGDQMSNDQQEFNFQIDSSLKDDKTWCLVYKENNHLHFAVSKTLPLVPGFFRETVSSSLPLVGTMIITQNMAYVINANMHTWDSIPSPPGHKWIYGCIMGSLFVLVDDIYRIHTSRIDGTSKTLVSYSNDEWTWFSEGMYPRIFLRGPNLIMIDTIRNRACSVCIVKKE